MKRGNYYLGLDIGTETVGYAVTDENYNLLKFNGSPAWGTTVFDAVSSNAERRSFRSARRRLDRRQQRVNLLQDLFAREIANVDENFYKRIRESQLYREDVGDKYILFNDTNYTDTDYFAEYPTIHHLINELVKNPAPHDVRLVYLACSWLVAHRGHFLNNMEKGNISDVKDFEKVYKKFLEYFTETRKCAAPWECDDIEAFGKAVKAKKNVTAKNKELIEVLLNGQKPSKETTEEFPFRQDCIIKLLAGGTCKLSDLFACEEYSDYGSISLGMDEDAMTDISSKIGDDYELISAMRGIYDWSLLVDILSEYSTISEAKVAVYEQHKKDLGTLKAFIKEYKPEKYNEVFREIGKDNYAAYSYHTDEPNSAGLKRKNVEDFSKYILGIINKIEPKEEDIEKFNDMKSRLELRTFLPKQRNTNNRVIPHKLYWHELNEILKNASEYLDFLNEKDEDGISVKDKILSVFMFKIPYFVGPLNDKSQNAWIVRKAGRIYPWNFESMVDLDASEDAFIRKMTNRCTYLPDEYVLPKDSLCYHKFAVLNEINNLKINGEKISVELKQRIYNELFLQKKKVTRKRIMDFLICNGYLEKGSEDLVSGIDINIKSNLEPQIAFRRLFENNILSESEAERIIERSSYAEDKLRFSKWLKREFPQLNDDDREYIGRLKFKDFGRLSRKFLCDFEGTDRKTGEVFTILGALWSTQNNLMELLSNSFTFAERIEEYQKEYYSENPKTLNDRLNEMYISDSVKRPIYRTLDIVKDVVKAFGVPKKIFVEMTRGGSAAQKGKRTKSRKQQILDLYEKCDEEDVRELKQQLESMGELADNKLQGDKLFLYYMQLGKCMYSGEPIKLEELGTKSYDIDHIYPQAYVKDDSIINNKVLVLSELNGEKGDSYPIKSNIRQKMFGWWKHLKDKELISGEKYKRLTRSTPFSDDEKLGFINRQLTETSQSTKAVATLLGEKYDTEIVYCKARLTSEFRQEFDLLKSRTFNDLHHAKDAYLNIVCGNVYNMKFTKKWFNIDSQYNIKTKALFSHPVICGEKTVWDGEPMLAKVKATVAKNNAHFTKYKFFKRGGLFDQNPVHAGADKTPLKKGLPTEKYGGYNKAGVMFFIPVKYTAGKKTEIIIMSVELLVGKKFLADKNFALEYSYSRLQRILGKPVDSISFPMGMTPWKVNTVLSLDGFRVCITGIGSGGKCLSAQPIMQFSDDKFWEYYLKKLEAVSEKIARNPKYVYSEYFDKVSTEKNIELYDLYLNKLKSTIYSKRINNPVAIVESGREKFVSLNIRDQVLTLLNLHIVFGRMTGGCDLSCIGGSKKTAATVSFSSTVSNWKKYYSDVRIIDQSASGLWEKKSENLLDLL